MMKIREGSYSLTDYESIYDRGGKVYMECSFSLKDGVSYFAYGDYSTRRTTNRRVVCNFDKTKLNVRLDYIAEKMDRPIEYYFTHQREAIFWALTELEEEVTARVNDYIAKHGAALKDFGKALDDLSEQERVE